MWSYWATERICQAVFTTCKKNKKTARRHFHISIRDASGKCLRWYSAGFLAPTKNCGLVWINGPQCFLAVGLFVPYKYPCLTYSLTYLCWPCCFVTLQLLSTRRHVIAYWPNLRSVVRHFVSVTTDDAAILAPAAVRSRDVVSSDSAKSTNTRKLWQTSCSNLHGSCRSFKVVCFWILAAGKSLTRDRFLLDSVSESSSVHTSYDVCRVRYST